MTKHPLRKCVRLEEIKEDYGAQFIEEALTHYIVQFNNPDSSQQQIEKKSAHLALPFLGLPVYHCIKINLAHADHHRIQEDETDVIHSNPARLDKYHNLIPGRFDIAIINDGDAQYIGVKGIVVFNLYYIDQLFTANFTHRLLTRTSSLSVLFFSSSRKGTVLRKQQTTQIYCLC